jgi:YD repeat-containing protein
VERGAAAPRRGNLKTRLDARDKLASYAYDEQGRLTGRLPSADGALTVWQNDRPAPPLPSLSMLVRFLFFALCIAISATVHADRPAELPDAAPLFAATVWDMHDRSFDLATLRGKPLVVNFWARWCGPCRVEIPHFAQARRKFKEKGLAVVGIGLEDKVDTVREFARAYEMDYTVLLAKDQGVPLLRALGNAKAGLPFTLVIDASGRVVATKLADERRRIDGAIARCSDARRSPRFRYLLRRRRRRPSARRPSPRPGRRSPKSRGSASSSSAVAGTRGGAAPARAGADLDVVVIERNASFWAGPLSNRWLAGLVDTRYIVHDRAPAAARHGYDLVQAEVTAVDRDRRRVVTGQGTLDYDWLVLGVGIRENFAAWFGDDRATADLVRARHPSAWRSGGAGRNQGSLTASPAATC